MFWFQFWLFHIKGYPRRNLLDWWADNQTRAVLTASWRTTNWAMPNPKRNYTAAPFVLNLCALMVVTVLNLVANQMESVQNKVIACIWDTTGLGLKCISDWTWRQDEWIMLVTAGQFCTYPWQTADWPWCKKTDAVLKQLTQNADVRQIFPGVLTFWLLLTICDTSSYHSLNLNIIT